MSDVRIVVQTLNQHRARSCLLVVTVAVAFLVYGVLGTLRFAMLGGSDEAAEGRLIVTHQAGITQTLPMSYAQQLAATEGVDEVGHATWFGAYFRSTNEMLLAFAVDAAVWFSQHPDMIVSEQDRATFLNDKQGMLVSEALAAKFGWHKDATVPLKSIMFFPANGEDYWPFNVAGVFRSSARSGGRNYILMHYNYLNDGRPYLKDTVGTFMVTASDPTKIEELASRIDERFANSSFPTSTATDRAFHAAFFKYFGQLFFMIKAITLVSFLSLVLIISSTLATAVQQRTKDIGILKSIGFSHGRIFRLLLLEVFSIVMIGGLFGLALATLVNTLLGTYLPQYVPSLLLALRIPLEAGLIMIAITIVASVVPAGLALRMRPSQAFSA